MLVHKNHQDYDI